MCMKMGQVLTNGEHHTPITTSRAARGSTFSSCLVTQYIPAQVRNRRIKKLKHVQDKMNLQINNCYKRAIKLGNISTAVCKSL